MAFKEQPTTPPPEVVLYTQFLGNEKRLSSWQKSKESARSALNRTSPKILVKVTEIVLQGISEDTTYWNSERRNASLELLQLVPLSKIPPEMTKNIHETYVTQVADISPNQDPLGPVDALLNAGKTLAPFFPKQIKRELELIWKEKGEGLHDKDAWSKIKNKVFEVKALCGTHDDKSNILPKPVIPKDELRQRKIQRLEKITQMYNNGELSQHGGTDPKQYLADLFNVTSTTIAHDLRELKIKELIPHKKPDNKAVIYQLHKKGVPPDEIAKNVGIQTKTVRAYLGQINPAETSRQGKRQKIIFELKRQDYSDTDIARQLGIQESTVTAYVRQLQRSEQLPKPQKKVSPNIEARQSAVAEYTEKGYSNKKIAEMLGVSETTIAADIQRITNGQTRQIPQNGEKERIRQRRLQVRELRDRGLSQRQIAKELGITLSTVQRDSGIMSASRNKTIFIAD